MADLSIDIGGTHFKNPVMAAGATPTLTVHNMHKCIEAGVGAIATQAHANLSFGPEGLVLLGGGLNAQRALDRLLAADPGREHRQVGLVDAQGRPATFTGNECYDWAGGLTGTRDADLDRHHAPRPEARSANQRVR